MLRFFCKQILHLLEEEEQPTSNEQEVSIKVEPTPVISEDTLTEEEILLLEEAEALELEGQKDMETTTKKKRKPSKAQPSDTPTKRNSPDRELEDEEVDDLLALVEEMKM
jgi:hypothetical protein